MQIADPTMLLHDLVQVAAHFEILQPRMRLSSNSTSLLSEFAVLGAGVAFKTRLGLHNELKRGELVFIPLSDAQLPSQHVRLWARHPQQFTAAAQSLAKTIARTIESLDERAGQ